MEKTGIIRVSFALLGSKANGVGMSVFAAVRTNQHNADWSENFQGMVADMSEVVEFYRMSDGVDYLLRVVVTEMAAYDRLYGMLIANVRLTVVNSSFATKEIKLATALPLPEASDA